MRSLATLGALLASGLLAGLAAAQPAPGPVPGGDGTIRVRVVYTDGSGAADLDVVLYALSETAPPGLERAVTDASGRVSFSGVITDPKTAYLVGVRASDVPYGERVAFEADGPKQIDLAIEVAPTDSDTSRATLGASTVRIDAGCDSLQVSEAHQVTNPTDRVLYVPEAERQGRTPVLVRELPLQAGPLDTALGMLPQGLERDGRTLRYWGPVYPGSQEIEFGYGLPLGAADPVFRWGFPAGAPDVSVLAPRDGAELRAPALAPAGEREIEGGQYSVLRARGVAPGAEVEIQIHMESAATAPIEVLESRYWIELDDALLLATGHHTIQVAGDQPLGPSAAPLLCIPLPQGAEEPRFGSDILGMGLTADASGALALRGPIPAGESVLEYSIRVPLGDGAAVFDHGFPLAVPLLEMFVADTGVRPLTERLHRLKPIRNAERNYLHLQGFGLGAGEKLRIVFERLPAPRNLPQLASLGFGLLAAGVTFAFLLGPLRNVRPEATRAPSRADELAAEREAVYGVIRDLDEDFETGKLSAEDYAAMRGEQRARAVTLLGQQRAALQEPAQAPAKASAQPSASETTREARFCTACGEALPARARFCPQCGEKTVTAGAADA